ncbi:hypothetical protein MCP1_100019 [Candidatus Terasakiella magnetica]|nr:hypothetical protein MCP1_100019 [Candidatus Terasakiella magnetica]
MKKTYTYQATVIIKVKAGNATHARKLAQVTLLGVRSVGCDSQWGKASVRGGRLKRSTLPLSKIKGETLA